MKLAKFQRTTGIRAAETLLRRALSNFRIYGQHWGVDVVFGKLGCCLGTSGPGGIRELI